MNGGKIAGAESLTKDLLLTGYVAMKFCLLNFVFTLFFEWYDILAVVFFCFFLFISVNYLLFLGMRMARFVSGMPPAPLCHFCTNCPLLVSLMLKFMGTTTVEKWRRNGHLSERYTEEW